MKKIKAFTLAETLIVLVILGIIASITIPAVIRNQIEAQNRTKIKKCMTVYDTALNKMVVENGIKSNDALINEFNAENNNNSCAKSRAYFKVSQEGANDCTFRASDGIWWNISDINHPIIAFNEDDLTDEIASGDTNKAFKLVGYLDNNGSLRVDDLGKVNDNDKAYLTKLYGFISGNKTNTIQDINTYEEYIPGKTQIDFDLDSFKTKYENLKNTECKDKEISCCNDNGDCFDETGYIFSGNGYYGPVYTYKINNDGYELYCYPLDENLNYGCNVHKYVDKITYDNIEIKDCDTKGICTGDCLFTSGYTGGKETCNNLGYTCPEPDSESYYYRCTK